MLLKHQLIECVVAQGGGYDGVCDPMEGDQGEDRHEEHPAGYGPKQGEIKEPSNPQADQRQKPHRPAKNLSHNAPFPNFG